MFPYLTHIYLDVDCQDYQNFINFFLDTYHPFEFKFIE